LLAKEFTNAVMRGDLHRLRDIVKLVEIKEKAIRRAGKRGAKPWHYYAGKAAWELLRDGKKLPTKKEVTEYALQERTLEELRCGGDSDWETKEKELRRLMPTKRNWAREYSQTCGYLIFQRHANTHIR
jgi:hypothetical protein